MNDVQLAATTVTVSRTVKIGRENEAQKTDVPETIEVHKFATTPAVAQVSADVKLAIDFCSAGISVGVQLPCYKEEIDAGTQAAYSIVMRRLAVEIPKVIKLATDLADQRRKIESARR